MEKADIKSMNLCQLETFVVDVLGDKNFGHDRFMTGSM